ncbi:ribonuclease J [uncultured bacterium]|nr:ribonuclease J [uncultured bacterium]
MSIKEIVVLPIGGTQSIGANCTIYYYNGNMLIVDYGIGVNSVDMYTPYESYLYDINNVFKYFKTKTLNLLITHIHEDHIGGIGFLIDNFLYYDNISIVIHICGKLSGYILNEKLNKTQLDKIKILYHDEYKSFNIDNNFEFCFMPVDHSVPEAYGAYIVINNYKIFHTGDWNINQYVPQNILEFNKFSDIINDLEKIDSYSIATFIKIRNKCNLIVGESTKIGDSNNKITECVVANELSKIINKHINKGYDRIFMTCFSSQINRIAAIINICMNHNIPVFLFSKSMIRVVQSNYFQENYPNEYNHINFLSNYKDFHNKKSGVYIVSGSQNEYNSVLYQLINYSHNFFNNRDLVVFTSPIIPGAYKQIEIISNQLIQLRVKLINIIINSKIHASGHAITSEIKFAYNLIQPNAILPVHGNCIKIQEHVNIANSMQLQSLFLRSGEAMSIINKSGVYKLSKIKVPIDIEDLRVKINNNFVRISDTCISEKTEIIKGGIIIIDRNNEQIYVFGAILENNTVAKIKKEMLKYDLNLHKSKQAFVKKIKLKFSFYGLIKIIN